MEKEELSKENFENKQEEQLITDFSDMFKGARNARKPPKLFSREQDFTPTWLLEIPAQLDLTKKQLEARKALDQRRWHCVVKSSDSNDRIVASVASIWNYLFSSKGGGNLPPLKLSQAKSALEQSKTEFYTEDEFERTQIILNCFQTLCHHFKVQASGGVFIKPTKPNFTHYNEQKDLPQFLNGLEDPFSAYLMITHDNIICPVGFEDTPLVPIDAYKPKEEIKKDKLELWILTASTNRFEPTFVIKRWKHIKQCLETEWPNYLDLEDAKKGPQRRAEANEQNQKEQKGSACCILRFRAVARQ